MVHLTVTFAIQHGLKCLRSLRMNDCERHNDDTASASPRWTQSEPLQEQSLETTIQLKSPRSSSEPSETLSDLLNDPIQNSLEIGNPISHTQVLELSKELKKNNIEPYHLDALLRGSNIWVGPIPKPKETTSEYKALMARLRKEQEARQYQELINPTTPAQPSSQNLPLSSAANAFTSTAAYIEDSPDDEATYADIKRQVTLIINVLVSIVACSFALWKVSRWWSTPARLALSFGGSILVAVAEVAIYWAYIFKVKESIKTEKKIKEVKTVKRTWVVGPGGDEVMETRREKEPDLLQSKEEEESKLRRRK